MSSETLVLLHKMFKEAVELQRDWQPKKFDEFWAEDPIRGWSGPRVITSEEQLALVIHEIEAVDDVSKRKYFWLPTFEQMVEIVVGCGWSEQQFLQFCVETGKPLVREAALIVLMGVKYGKAWFDWPPLELG